MQQRSLAQRIASLADIEEDVNMDDYSRKWAPNDLTATMGGEYHVPSVPEVYSPTQSVATSAYSLSPSLR